VPDSVCRRHTALPIGYDEGKLVVAMADPANVFALDDMRSMAGMEIRPVVATSRTYWRRSTATTAATPSSTT
jgi:type IV pilus assembly protein PilB